MLGSNGGARARGSLFLVVTWLTLALASASCADRTSILVLVSSDMTVPDAVDRLDFSVRGMSSGMVVERSFPLTTTWPHSLALRPGMVESSNVLITVTAMHGDVFVARRVVEGAFSPGFENVIEVVIESACRDVRCEMDLDCRGGNCIGARPDAGPLPPDAAIDASTDVGSDVNEDAPCGDPALVNCGMVCIDPQMDNMFCGAQPGCMDFDRCVGSEFCDLGVCRLDCLEAGQINCEGTCIDPDSERAHCGATAPDCMGGVECPGVQVCALGVCSDDCPPGLNLCEGRCVDPRSDRRFCGARADCSGGTACLAGEACSEGICTTMCPMDQYFCGGRCVDPMSDRAYCGTGADCMSGTSCPSGQLCIGGMCGATCPDPQIACGGRCVDTQSDESYCGAMADCTGGDACGSGEICRGGICVTNCPEGQVGCDGLCIDPLTDEAYCGASITCTGAVACAARQTCTDGMCTCVAPERECGMGCVDTRFDPTNCGGCGNVCPPAQSCQGSACAPIFGGGFTGEFGTTWTVLAFRDVNCVEEFVPRVSTDLYAGIGATFGAYEMAALNFRPEIAPPFAIGPDCSFAFLAGGIWMLNSTDVMVYSPPMMEWRTLSLPMPLGTIGMTITDGISLWTANATHVIRGSPATSDVEFIPAGTTGMMRPRITYDALTGRIYFAGQGQRQLRSYDPVTRELRVEATAPANIGAPFCSDRAGHIYVGSGAEPRQLWQFSPASGRFRDLPLIPGFATGVTNCGIAEAGAIYVAAEAGMELYRLPLERL